MASFAQIGSVMTAVFLASLVEAVEALTIILAVATVRGWRPAGLGALAGLAFLAVIVAVLGPALEYVPLHLLQLAIGVLLLLFGMRWLRKAILRAAGFIPLHDEATAFAAATAELHEQGARQMARADWLAAIASFKAVLLEGLEVVFIVIAVSAGRGLLVPASVSAFPPQTGVTCASCGSKSIQLFHLRQERQPAPRDRCLGQRGLSVYGNTQGAPLAVFEYAPS